MLFFTSALQSAESGQISNSINISTLDMSLVLKFYVAKSVPSELMGPMTPTRDRELTTNMGKNRDLSEINSGPCHSTALEHIYSCLL